MSAIRRSYLVFGVYFAVLFGAVLLACSLNYAVTVISENAEYHVRHNVVIDAGHGGVDGGATSCSGVLESAVNLEIALKLNDLLRLLGVRTIMIRTTDISVYTEGETIAAKKVSDLKQRVKIVKNTDHAILVSIHQNYFSDSRYSGAQVFYAETADSLDLAKRMQTQLVKSLNKGSNRKVKKADNIYLMEHIQCPGVLIECGFLSNPAEDKKLNDPDYQRKISCVIASVLNNYLSNRNVA